MIYVYDSEAPIEFMPLMNQIIRLLEMQNHAWIELSTVDDAILLIEQQTRRQNSWNRCMVIVGQQVHADNNGMARSNEED